MAMNKMTQTPMWRLGQGACSLLIETNPCLPPGMTTKCSQKLILYYCSQKNKFTLDHGKIKQDPWINVSQISILPEYECNFLEALALQGKHLFALPISVQKRLVWTAQGFEHLSLSLYFYCKWHLKSQNVELSYLLYQTFYAPETSCKTIVYCHHILFDLHKI